MKRKTPFLAMLPGLLAPVCFVQAAEPTTNPATGSSMEHVLVTVPIHKTQAETALPVTVLSGEALHAAIASTIGATLATTPGLANAGFGPAVGQPVIRGQQGPRVMVLQNSTASGDAANVSADHAVSVEPILAESIEVLRGPATLLYGGGAIGGVVNVIDNRVPDQLPDNTLAAMEYRHNTANDENTTVFKVDSAAGQWAVHVDGVYRETNNLHIDGFAQRLDDGSVGGSKGFIANSDSRSQAFTVGSAYVFDRGFIGLAVNRQDSEYGLPPQPQSEADEGDIRLDIAQTRYDLRGVWDEPVAGWQSLRWYLTHSDYRHLEIEGSGEVGTVFSNDSWENRLELVHQQWRGWHGVVGLQVGQRDFAAVGEESFIPPSELARYGLFMLEDYHRDNWLYEVGVRFDRVVMDTDFEALETRRFNAFSASGSALWTIDSHWSLALAVTRSQRAPTVEELYSNIGNDTDFVVHAATQAVELGRADLSQEETNTVDMSLWWRGLKSEASLTLFYNDFSDYIYLQNSGLFQDGVPVLAYSQQDANFSGVEFELQWPLAELWGSDIKVSVFGDYIRGELSDGSAVARMPPRRIGGELSIEEGPFAAYLRVVDVQKQHRAGVNESATAGYTRWDAGLNYTFKQGRRHEYLAFLSLHNMGDKEIRNSVSLLRDAAPEGGFAVELGLRFSLK